MHPRVAVRALRVVALVAGAVLGRSPSLSRALAVAARATFPEAGKTFCDPFLAYWRSHGGLAQQGLPLTDAFNVVNPTNCASQSGEVPAEEGK